MREIHKITLTGFSDLTKRAKAVDIISAALVKEFARKVAVSPEGFMSDSVLNEMPSSTSVFLICNDSAVPIRDEEYQEPEAIPVFNYVMKVEEETA